MLASDRASRSARFKEIHAQYGEGNVAFSERLNARARELGLEEAWTDQRVSKVRSALQDLSPDDITVIASLDRQGRGYTYIAHGVAVDPGEDAWAALAKAAKRKPKSA